MSLQLASHDSNRVIHQSNSKRSYLDCIHRDKTRCQPMVDMHVTSEKENEVGLERNKSQSKIESWAILVEAL